MKKILASIGVILIVAVLGIAGGITFANYQNDKSEKEEAKVEKAKKTEKTTKKEKSDKNTSKSNENQQTTEETTNINQDVAQQQVPNTTNQVEQTTETNQNEMIGNPPISQVRNGVDLTKKYPAESDKEEPALDGNGDPMPVIEVHDFTDENGDGIPETINGLPNGDVGIPVGENISK